MSLSTVYQEFIKPLSSLHQAFIMTSSWLHYDLIMTSSSFHQAFSMISSVLYHNYQAFNSQASWLVRLVTFEMRSLLISSNCFISCWFSPTRELHLQACEGSILTTSLMSSSVKGPRSSYAIFPKASSTRYVLTWLQNRTRNNILEDGNQRNIFLISTLRWMDYLTICQPFIHVYQYSWSSSDTHCKSWHFHTAKNF